MELAIKGEAKEIAALVVAIQERRGPGIENPINTVYQAVLKRIGRAAA